MEFDKLFERREIYCIKVVKNWDKRRSKIITHYLDTKSFLSPYEERSRHMRLTLLLDTWIDEVLMYYRDYYHKREPVMTFRVSKNQLCQN